MENWSAYVMKGGLFLILLAAACIDSQQSITTSVQNGHTTTKTTATFGSYVKGTSLASEELSKTTQDIITAQENGKTSQQTHVASSKPVSLPMENTEKASESPAKTENILVSTNSTTSISISLISDSSLASTTANDFPVQIKTDHTSLSTTRSHTEALTLTLPTQSDLVTADELVSTDERSSAEAATVFPTLTFKNSTSASQELTFSKETIDFSSSSSTVQESASPTADLDTATSNQKRLSTLSVTSSPHENPFFTGPSALTPTTDYFRSKGTPDHTASVDSLQLQTSDTESTMASLVTHSDTNSAQTSSTTRLVTQGPPTKLPATEQFSTRIFTENHSTTNEKDTTLETAATHTSAFDTTGSNTQNVRDVATLLVSLLSTTMKSTIKESTTMVVSSSSEKKSQTTDLLFSETPRATQLTTLVTARIPTISNSSEVPQPDTTAKSTIISSTTMSVSSSSERKSQTTDIKSTETSSATQLTTSVTDGNVTASNSSEVLQQLTTTMKSTKKASTTMVVSSTSERKSQTTDISFSETPSATHLTTLVTARIPTTLNSSEVPQPDTTVKSTIKASTTMSISASSMRKSQTTDIKSTETSSKSQLTTSVTDGNITASNSSEILQQLTTTMKSTIKASTTMVVSSSSEKKSQITDLPFSETPSATQLTTFVTERIPTTLNSSEVPQQLTTTMKSTIKASRTMTESTSLVEKSQSTNIKSTVTKPANDGNQPVTVGSTEKARTTNRVTQSLTCEMPSTDQKDTTSTLQTSSSVTVESPQRLSTSDTSSTKSLASNSIKISTSFFQLIPTNSATKTTTASTVTKQVTNNTFFTTALQNMSKQFSPNGTVQTPDQKATETYTKIQPHSQLGEGFTSTQTTSLASSQRTTIVPQVSPSEITTAKKQSVAEEHDATSTKKQQTSAKHATDTTTPSGSEFVSRIRGFTAPTTLSMETTATQSFAPTVNVRTSANFTATNKEISISAATVTAPIAALTGAASVQTTTQTISPLTTHTTATQTTTIGSPRFLEPTNPGKNLDTKNIASLSTSPLVTNTMQNSGFKDSSVSPSQRETMTMSSQGPFTEASSKSAKTEILTTVELASPALMSINPDKTLVTFSKGTTQYATQEGKTNSPTSTQMSSSVSKDTQTTTITAPVLPLVSGLSSAATTSNTSPMTGYSPASHKRTSTPSETTGLEKTENTDALSKPTIGSSISPSILLNDSKTAPNTTLGVSLSSSKSMDGTLSSNPSSLRPSSTEAASPMEMTTSMKMVSQTIAAGDFSEPTSQRTVSANPSSNASVSSSAQSNTTQKQPGASSPAPRDSVVFFKLRKIAVVTRLVFEHPTFVRATFRAANATD